MAHPVLEFLMTTKMPRHLDKTNKDNKQIEIEIEMFRTAIINFNHAWIEKTCDLLKRSQADFGKRAENVRQLREVLDIAMIQVRTITNPKLIIEITKQIKDI